MTRKLCQFLLPSDFPKISARIAAHPTRTYSISIRMAIGIRAKKEDFICLFDP
jgi:hypothetical protein